MPSALTIVLVVAGIGYVLFRRLRGEPLQPKRLLVLPAIFTIIGIVDLTKAGAPHLTSGDLGFLVAGCAVSAVLGAARGATIVLFPRDGHLWQRYRGITVGLWALLILLKVGLGAAASAAGDPGAAGTHNLLLALGISLLAESALVAPRALSTGIPLAPDRGGLLGGALGGSGGGGGRSRRGGLVQGALDRLSEPSTGQPGDQAGPAEPAGSTDAAPWRSPGMREGLGWLRGQLDQPGGEPRSPGFSAARPPSMGEWSRSDRRGRRSRRRRR